MEDVNGERDRSAEVAASVAALLGAEGMRATYAPIEEASGLPRAAFLSDEWLALEQERVFGRNWVFAGAAAEIPEPGDMKPVEIAGAPLVMVRDATGIVRGFHNFCRHRGAQIVAKPGAGKVFKCPYHLWTYGLDGKLRSRPHFVGANQHERFEDGGGPRLDLVPVRTEVWNGCTFVNLDGTAPSVEQWLAPLTRRTAAYDFSAIRWAGKIEFDIAANWKLVYENYMEGYHVFALHPGLLKFAPMNIRWSGEWDEHVFYNDYVFAQPEAGRGQGLPTYPGLGGEDANRGLWFLAFPHFAAEVYPDQFTILVAYPVAPDRTREELHVFLIGDAADGDQYADARDELFALWDELNREDIGALELLQAGRRSPAFDGGRLSPHWEGPTHEFGRRIVGEMVRR